MYFVLFVCFFTNKEISRKQNAYYFRAKAVCKFSNCLEFTFLIKKGLNYLKSNDTIIVEYIASGALSEQH